MSYRRYRLEAKTILSPYSLCLKVASLHGAKDIHLLSRPSLSTLFDPTNAPTDLGVLGKTTNSSWSVASSPYNPQIADEPFSID